MYLFFCLQFLNWTKNKALSLVQIFAICTHNVHKCNKILLKFEENSIRAIFSSWIVNLYMEYFYKNVLMWYSCILGIIKKGKHTQVKCTEEGDKDSVHTRKVKTLPLLFSLLHCKVAPPSHLPYYLSSLFPNCILLWCHDPAK